MSAIAQDLIRFIDQSPSPAHAIATCQQRLRTAGYQALNADEEWQLQAGKSYFVCRGAGSIIAFSLAAQANAGFRLVCAHTDSPTLKLKPRAAYSSDGLCRIGVEVYGSPILATFADRDLGLAGRVAVQLEGKTEYRLVSIARPILRLPNLAIHLNRDVNDQGLKFNKQTQLPLILGQLQGSADAEQTLLSLIAENAGCSPEQILSMDLNVVDLQAGAIWGAHEEFISDGQLDNLASCHSGLSALLASQAKQQHMVCALFDHEEVGSESASGADGSFLSDTLSRISHALGLTQPQHLQSLSKSFVISADMAHAFHPNHADKYEPCHHVSINQGPVIKHNVNQRYATGLESSARFIQLCKEASVPYQQYSHRSDLGCGSTVGPMVAAQLGVDCVDVGCAMWSMHSIRETAGILDIDYMIRVLTHFYSS
jgi:aspartyl aminopeptidase